MTKLGGDVDGMFTIGQHAGGDVVAQVVETHPPAAFDGGAVAAELRADVAGTPRLYTGVMGEHVDRCRDASTGGDADLCPVGAFRFTAFHG